MAELNSTIVKGKLSVTDEINIGGRSILDNVAAPYSSSSTYSVGALCVYGGVLYQCTTAVSSAESFNPSKWQETSVAAAVLGLINTGV